MTIQLDSRHKIWNSDNDNKEKERKMTLQSNNGFYMNERVMLKPKIVDFYLRDAAFPALKDDLVMEAESQKAPFNILDVLSRFDDRVYRSLEEVKIEFQFLKSQDFEKFCA